MKVHPWQPPLLVSKDEVECVQSDKRESLDQQEIRISAEKAASKQAGTETSQGGKELSE